MSKGERCTDVLAKMADEGLADHYQVLEELGRKFGQGSTASFAR